MEREGIRETSQGTSQPKLTGFICSSYMRAWAWHTNRYSGSTQAGPGQSTQTYIQAQHRPIFRLNTNLYSGSTQTRPGRSTQTYIQAQHRQLLVALCSMQKDLTFFLQPWYTTADDIKRSKTTKQQQQNAQENHSRYPTGCQPADQCVHPLVAAPRCNGRRTRSAAK